MIDEARLERPVLLDAAHAGEPPVDVVVRAEDRRDAREHRRLVPLDPAQLGRDELLVDAVAGRARGSRPRRLRAASSATSAAARPSLCWMLGRRTCAVASSRTSAGTMPVTQMPGKRAAGRRQRRHQLAEDRAGVAPTTPPGPPPPSSDAARTASTGREATATTVSGRPIRMPIVDVVPMSRPMTRRLRRPRRSSVPPLSRSAQSSTTSMKRFTRSPSTGFQVLPSTLKWVPMTQPSAIAKMSRTLSMSHAGIGEERHVRAPPRAPA